MMDALTFNDLRKIQKEERREEELVELDENFFLKAKEYLNRKEDNGDQRDYTSSKRVFRKIIALREKKIVKNARISLKSNIKASELNLLPREKELFRETKELFEEHRDRIEEINQKAPGEIETDDIETEDLEPETTESEVPDETEKEEENQKETRSEKEKEDSEDIEDGYQKVKIVNEVPEFMGTDLESYGPFEEGDRPVIPEDNAEILVNRGNAEEA